MANDKPEYGKVYSLTGSGNSIANGNSWAESEVKKYKVLLTAYPEEFEIEATTEEEAIRKAKDRFGKSVWESEAELIE